MGIDANRSIQELLDVGFSEGQAKALVSLISSVNGQRDIENGPALEIPHGGQRLTWPMFAVVVMLLTAVIAWALLF